jgi:hypothetical protein
MSKTRFGVIGVPVWDSQYILDAFGGGGGRVFLLTFW